MKNKILLLIIVFLFIPIAVSADNKCRVISGDTGTVGSEIECGTENFYLISNNGSVIRMLAKYNLYTGIEIHKVKIEKEEGDTRTDAQYCTDLANANGGTVKSDGFYTAPGYCFYSVKINEAVMKQKSTALSAHWDEEGNYLYPQVGDNYMHSGINSSKPAEAATIDSSVTYSDTRFKDFVVTTTATTDLSRALAAYKATLEGMNYEVMKMDLLSLQEIEDIVYNETSQRFPLTNWGNEVLSTNYNSNINPEFGHFDNYLDGKYPWLYSTTYWNKTIFAKEGYGPPSGSLYSNWYYVFVAQQGKICGAGFYNCAPETQLGCGIRPVVELPVEEVRGMVDNGITIESIDYVEKGGSARINNKATTDGVRVDLDLTFFDVNDYVKYVLNVKNNTTSDLYINDKYFNYEKDFVSYEFDSNFIKAGEEKTINLTIIYKKEAPRSTFVNGILNVSSSDPLIFSNQLINIPDTLKLMGFAGILMLGITLVSIIIGIVLIVKYRKVTTMSIILLFVPLILIPKLVEAAIRIEIPINSNILLKTDKANPCTFSGDMVQGAKFVKGQYTYSYKQEASYITSWDNIEEDGWGVMLTDKNSSYPVYTELCSSINGKPIVSMANMFVMSKSKDINVSSFDTSNVVNMYNMFGDATEIKALDVSNFDTAKVKNMSYMFTRTRKLKYLDVGSFDTSKVTNMSGMFFQMNSVENIDGLNNFDTSNVKTVYNMFAYDNNMKKIKITNWDLSNVEEASYMFQYFGQLSEELDVEIKNLNLTGLNNNLYSLFEYLGYTSKKLKVDIDNINIPTTKVVQYLFARMGYYSLDSEININNIQIKNSPKVYSLFYSLGQESNADISITNINLESCDVNSNHFQYIGYSSPTEITVNIDNINMKTIPTLGEEFRYMANNANKADITINNVNINSATSLSHGFYSIGQTSKDLRLVVSNLKAHSATDASYCFRYTGQSTNNTYVEVKNWETPEVTSLYTFFDHIGQSTKNNLEIVIDNMDTSKVTSTRWMFFSNGESNRGTTKIKFKDFDTSHVTDMSEMFIYTGTSSPQLTLEGIENFDYSSVTNFNGLFQYTSRGSAERVNIGTINVYNPANISNMFNYFKDVKAVVNLYSKPTSYGYAFYEAATKEGAEIIVNYSTYVDNIDDIIATKSEGSNVIKGEVIYYEE